MSFGGNDPKSRALQRQIAGHKQRCKALPELKPGEADDLVTAYLRSNSITQCPTRFAEASPNLASPYSIHRSVAELATLVLGHAKSQIADTAETLIQVERKREYRRSYNRVYRARQRITRKAQKIANEWEQRLSAI
jgi:hypothetical protein